MKYKSTKYCIGTYSYVDIKCINKAKDLINRNYGNIYNTPSHITYNLSPIPKGNLRKVKIELENYIKKQKPFNIQIGKLKIDRQKRFIYLTVEGDELFRLHVDLLDIMNKFRKGFIRKKDLRRLKKDPGYYSEIQKKNILKYGYARTQQLFTPHITIGAIKASANLDMVVEEINELVKDYLLTHYTIKDINILAWIASTEDKPGEDIFETTYRLK